MNAALADSSHPTNRTGGNDAHDPLRRTSNILMAIWASACVGLVALWAIIMNVPMTSQDALVMAFVIGSLTAIGSALAGVVVEITRLVKTGDAATILPRLFMHVAPIVAIVCFAFYEITCAMHF
ncbi:MAG: hypothetical protein GC162_01650 [Planctomycetes bacterium]|nr:hypothetical protein [Planctomycetota bacterium]